MNSEPAARKSWREPSPLLSAPHRSLWRRGCAGMPRAQSKVKVGKDTRELRFESLSPCLSTPCRPAISSSGGFLLFPSLPVSSCVLRALFPPGVCRRRRSHGQRPGPQSLTRRTRQPGLRGRPLGSGRKHVAAVSSRWQGSCGLKGTLLPASMILHGKQEKNRKIHSKEKCSFLTSTIY